MGALDLTKVFVFSGFMVFGACAIGDTGPIDDGTGEIDDDDVGGDDSVGLSGTLTDSATLDGDILLSGDTTIAAGVTITIAAGSSVTAADGVHLIVQGQLLVDGSETATVSMIPTEGADEWGGIRVAAGGSATVRYATGTKVATLMDCQADAAECVLERIDFADVGVVIRAASTAVLKESIVVGMANGAVTVTTGGNLSVLDTELMTTSHDLVTASGGSLTIEYSNIGGTLDTYEHCNLHIGSADSLTISYSNIVTGQYGMMIGNVAASQVNNNNWQGNTTDISVVGSPTSADFQNNYWEGGPPPPALGAEFNFANAQEAPVAEAGPRI